MKPQQMAGRPAHAQDYLQVRTTVLNEATVMEIRSSREGWKRVDATAEFHAVENARLTDVFAACEALQSELAFDETGNRTASAQATAASRIHLGVSWSCVG
ncbi:hypothetical protein, partial [Paraburkholderia oxyphila]|uniref:hypothetical protein n=1 Tax=Paraburkholderia oxyphila TaxID=614212 RepID=UPI001C3F30F9